MKRKLNDLSFFWHSGPEPFAKDLTIFAAWIASDEYDRTGHLLNVPMNVYPFMNKRHRMSRFDPQGSFFIRVESWDLVRRSNGTKKSRADLCGWQEVDLNPKTTRTSFCVGKLKLATFFLKPSWSKWSMHPSELIYPSLHLVSCRMFHLK